MTECVTLSVENGVALMTLDRPESLNALSKAMMKALEERIDALAEMPELRVVILTATGRGFCAGGDLKEFEEELHRDKRQLLATLSYNQGVIAKLENLPVPVIAAVNGVAVAGGLELLLACDLIVAAAGAKMGDGHAKYAIVPAGGATVRLAEKVSPARAAELFYTAKLVDAETMAEWGLVNEVVSRERVLPRAREIAAEICSANPSAIRHIKQLTRPCNRLVERSIRLEVEIEHFRQHLDGPDMANGLAAFRGK
ncbi:enoyl-CoA hydratase/isomerase family protein [Roseibium sp.]|uniref:enoyl-CoA hydratase/isomerase family protein n=1 Tax=Roseibium sp. TaxID=1936156 RepID=UPI003A9884EC